MRAVTRLRLIRRGILLAGDVLILCTALAISLKIREPRLLQPGVFLSFVPTFAMWLTTFYVIGLYEPTIIRNFVLLMRGLLTSWALCLIEAAICFYALTPYLNLTPKTHLFVAATTVHAAILIWRRAALTVFGVSVFDLNLVMLADEDHRHYLNALAPGRFDKWQDTTHDVGPDVELVVVEGAWAERNPESAHRVFAAALASAIPVVSLDEFYESAFGQVSPARAGDLEWMLNYLLPRSGSLYFKVKRLVDIVASLVLLIAFSPLMLLIAVTIRVVDGIRPLYRQVRVGYLARPFVLWKFQSMVPDTTRELPLIGNTNAHDGRVTHIGYWLRRLRLDELPQLWNVLVGEMSLVGPRPEWIREVEILENAIPTYHLRHFVPPGLTGWAQVYFRATNRVQDSIRKHHYDLYYLKHFSLALDFSIMLKTIKRVFVRDSRVMTHDFPLPVTTDRETPVPFDATSIVGR